VKHRSWLVAALLVAGCGGAAGPGGIDAAAEPKVTADGAAPDGEGAADAQGVPPDAASDVAPDRAPELPPPPAPYARPSYTTLSGTGLYADLASRKLSPQVEEFRPTHALWSDGAEKRRWVQLPPGTKVDTSTMDRWVVPIGTRFWKEFSKGGVLLETRLVERYGTGPDDYWMGAFVWKADQSDAVYLEAGQEDINGTTHDAPPQKHCGACHNGEPGRALGFSALQLSREGEGLTLDALARAGRLSDPPPAGATFHVPGDPLTAEALGYLHANCGHCHNLRGTSWPDTQMVLRLETTDTTVEGSGVWKSLVGQKLQYWRHDGFSQRVVPGDAATSAVLYRMQTRVKREAMPPLATELVDPTGVDIVTRWITSLPKPPAP
jgi:hypothetical protein